MILYWKKSIFKREKVRLKFSIFDPWRTSMTAPKINSLFIFSLENLVETLGDGLMPASSVEIIFTRLIFVETCRKNG